jgi:hypothetical protein
MNLKFPILAMVFLLTSGVALAQPDKASADKDSNAVPAIAAASGASSISRQQAQDASAAVRTREEVHAEAVEAAKHHRSTLSLDLDFYKN